MTLESEILNAICKASIRVNIPLKNYKTLVADITKAFEDNDWHTIEDCDVKDCDNCEERRRSRPSYAL